MSENPAFGPVIPIQIGDPRTDRAVDFLLGQQLDFMAAKTVTTCVADAIILLELTRGRNLPNRERLLALVEAAMPKEESRG